MNYSELIMRQTNFFFPIVHESYFQDRFFFKFITTAKSQKSSIDREDARLVIYKNNFINKNNNNNYLYKYLLG